MLGDANVCSTHAAHDFWSVLPASFLNSKGCLPAGCLVHGKRCGKVQHSVQRASALQLTCLACRRRLLTLEPDSKVGNACGAATALKCKRMMPQSLCLQEKVLHCEIERRTGWELSLHAELQKDDGCFPCLQHTTIPFQHQLADQDGLVLSFLWLQPAAKHPAQIVLTSEGVAQW